MNLKNLFSTACSEKELKIRNYVLLFVQITLWLAVTFFGLIVVGRCVFIGLDRPTITEWTLAIVSVILALRFEFWAANFRGYFYSRCGQDWVVNGYKDNRWMQDKFFTCKYHKDGDLNPLW